MGSKPPIERSLHLMWGTDASTSGAIGELLVCAELMKRGFQVFRAMSPSCPCDLVVYKDNQPLRVQVKLGHFRGGKRVSISPTVLDPAKYDILATVYDDEVHFAEAARGLGTIAAPPVDSETPKVVPETVEALGSPEHFAYDKARAAARKYLNAAKDGNRARVAINDNLFYLDPAGQGKS